MVDRGVSDVSVRVGWVELSPGDTEALGDTRALTVRSFSGVKVADGTTDHSCGSGVGEATRLDCWGESGTGVAASATSTKPSAKRVRVGMGPSITGAQLANNNKRKHQTVAFSSPSSIKNNRLLRRARSMRSSSPLNELALMTRVRRLRACCVLFRGLAVARLFFGCGCLPGFIAHSAHSAATHVVSPSGQLRS